MEKKEYKIPTRRPKTHNEKVFFLKGWKEGEKRQKDRVIKLFDDFLKEITSL